MFRALKEVLPALQSIALDAMHIVMVYKQNMNNKKNTGKSLAVCIMDKFRKRDLRRSSSSWGPFYTGQDLPLSSADVRAVRARLELADMSHGQAFAHLEQIDPNQPWLTEVDFLGAVLAHVSLFSEELQKVTYSGVSLHRLIVNVASPAKTQWLLNDTRYRHSVDRRSWFFCRAGRLPMRAYTMNSIIGSAKPILVCSICVCVLFTCNVGKRPLRVAGCHAQGYAGHEIEFFQLVKLLAHNQALYRPMVKLKSRAEP